MSGSWGSRLNSLGSWLVGQDMDTMTKLDRTLRMWKANSKDIQGAWRR